MSIATVDDIVTALAGNSDCIDFYKTLPNVPGTGTLRSLWMGGGSPPSGTGATPPAYTAGSGYTCSSATAGALGPLENAGAHLWLAKARIWSTGPGWNLRLYDRLWNCGGMGFTASTYTVTTPGSLPARITDSGVGVEAWYENFVASGAASGTLTLTYKNVDGTSHTSVINAISSAPIGTIIPFPLAAGDTGVSQVVSLANSATFTSGSFGVSLMKPICDIPITEQWMRDYDWATLGLPPIENDSCMTFYAQSTNIQNTVYGRLILIDK